MPGGRCLLLAHEADVRDEALHVQSAPEVQLPVFRPQRSAPGTAVAVLADGASHGTQQVLSSEPAKAGWPLRPSKLLMLRLHRDLHDLRMLSEAEAKAAQPTAPRAVRTAPPAPPAQRRRGAPPPRAAAPCRHGVTTCPDVDVAGHFVVIVAHQSRSWLHARSLQKKDKTQLDAVFLSMDKCYSNVAHLSRICFRSALVASLNRVSAATVRLWACAVACLRTAASCCAAASRSLAAWADNSAAASVACCFSAETAPASRWLVHRLPGPVHDITTSCASLSRSR